MSQSEGNTILVVEDDATLRFVLERQLSTLGFTADFVSNGAEAVEKARGSHYQLVLMDIMMPVLDGCEATSLIRREEEAGNMPHLNIVAMTAFADRQRCLEAGMDGFVFKPVLLEQLQTVLRQWLEMSA